MHTHEIPVPDHTLGSGAVVRCCEVGYSRGGRQVLSGINLDINSGEVLAVVGPNGSGKSTLLGAIAGDCAHGNQSTRTGTVHLGADDVDLLSPGDRATRRALLSQQHQSPNGYTVRDIVSMGRDPHPRRPGHDEKILDWAMAATEVAHLERRFVHHLSGGETARVAMARTLAQNTPVVLLDEPTAALDLRHQSMVVHTARALAAHGRAVVAVLHDLSLAAWADRVVLLANGRIRAIGTPAELFCAEHIDAVYHAPTYQCPVAGTGRSAVVPAIDQPLPMRQTAEPPLAHSLNPQNSPGRS